MAACGLREELAGGNSEEMLAMRDHILNASQWKARAIIKEGTIP